MTFKEHVISVYKTNFANFSGRASLSEFWFTYLSAPLITIVASLPALLLGAAFGQDGYNVGVAIYCIVGFGLLIPQFAVMARRLHDVGKSAWWLLLFFVPFGFIALLVFWLRESDGDNRWGKKPGKTTPTHSAKYLTKDRPVPKVASSHHPSRPIGTQKDVSAANAEPSKLSQLHAQTAPHSRPIQESTPYAEHDACSNLIFSNKQLAAIYKLALGLIGACSTGLTEKKFFILTYGLNRFNVSTSVLERLAKEGKDHIEGIFGLDHTMQPREITDVISRISSDKKRYISAYLQLIIAADGKLEDSALLFWQLNAAMCNLPTVSIKEATTIIESL